MTILDKIAAKTTERIAEEQTRVPLATVRAQAESIVQAEKEAGMFASFPFERALREADLGLICEVKKASPSKGVIEPDFHPLEIARAYEQAGADAISCLTEPHWFLGSDEYLKAITNAVAIPVLRKDFTINEYMIYQAKALGASAVLLICSMLDDAQLAAYSQLAEDLGLSALVEAHDRTEVERALASNARILGVNNRNLKDFSVDFSNAGNLRTLVPENVVFVAESGVTRPADMEMIAESGADAALIGEALMRATDKCAAITEMRLAVQRGKMKASGPATNNGKMGKARTGSAQ